MSSLAVEKIFIYRKIYKYSIDILNGKMNNILDYYKKTDPLDISKGILFIHIRHAALGCSHAKVLRCTMGNSKKLIYKMGQDFLCIQYDF